MLQPNNTEKESRLFTGRTSVMKNIEDSISNNNFAAVLAHSGFGRTAILKHLSQKKDYFYLDMRKFSLSPENFAVDLIGSICFFNSTEKSASVAAFQSIDKLKSLKLNKKCIDIIYNINNELQKIKPDQTLLLKEAFRFAEAYASETKKQTIILNNFDELLKLNNFAQVKDALKIFFETISKNKNASFIIASSAAQVMKAALKNFTKDIIEIPPLSLEETKELFEKIAGKTEERIIKEVDQLTDGMPMFIKTIAERFSKEKTNDTQKNIKLIRYLLLSEITTKNSSSYSYCSRLFTDSLNRARGEALLKTILKVVSQNEPLRLTEVARLVYRSGPVTKSLLERLVEVDLIVKTDKTFDFANSVLKMWCKLMFSNIEFKEVPDEKYLSESGGLQ